MQISTNEWNYNISSIGLNTQQTTSSVENKYTKSSGTDTDEMAISEKGQMMSNMMSSVREIDSEEMEARMTEVDEAIASLKLDELEVDEMSREELETVISDIQTTMSALRPEGVNEENTFSTEDLSDDELKEMITSFSNSTKTVQGGFDQMETMAGKTPPPPPPSGGGGAASVYGTEDTEESDELTLIEELIESLKEDEESDEASESQFINTILSYLEENTDITL